MNFNVQIYQDKRFHCKRIGVYSKELFNTIEKRISLKDKSEEFNMGFVSGIIDSEGYVNDKKSFVMVVNTNKNMLDDCKEFLRSIQINSSISKRKPSKYEVLDSYRM